MKAVIRGAGITGLALLPRLDKSTTAVKESARPVPSRTGPPDPISLVNLLPHRHRTTGTFNVPEEGPQPEALF
jgi:hypothetical protein